MKFSIIVPIYNCERFLPQTVAAVSLLSSRTAHSVELLLTDDGSLDGSGKLADSFADANREPNLQVTVIHQKNRGVSAARNAALSLASGDFILFWDCDDGEDIPLLTECMNRMADDDSLDLCIFGISFDYYHGNHLYRNHILLPPLSGIFEKEQWQTQMPKLFSHNCLSPVWNKIIRAGKVKSLAFRNEMFLCEDLEYSLRLMAHCNRILFFQTPVYRYRQDESHGISRIKRLNCVEEITDVIAEALTPFPTENDRIVLDLKRILAVEKLAVTERKQQKSYYLSYPEVFGKTPFWKYRLFRFYLFIRHRFAETWKRFKGRKK